MYETPIFDCLTHPSLDGSWLHPRWSGNNTFQNLLSEMDLNNVPWAFVVAMGTEGSYDLSCYAAESKQHSSRFFPIAYLDFSNFTTLDSLTNKLAYFKQQGYVGIKIHPRLAGIDLHNSFLESAINIANQLNMCVFLCTYSFSNKLSSCNCTVQDLYKLLHKVPEQKIILLHSGGVNLMEVMEMTRPFKKVLLDLSFTMCEYENSSIDIDLKFILNRHYFRVCIGSDHPEFSIQKMRDRFEELTAGLEDSKKQHIAYKNLFNFTGIEYEYER